MRIPRKFPRLKAAKQIKPIELAFLFPLGTIIELDKKRTVENKRHCLFYSATNSSFFGGEGDICEYISHEKLFDLARTGFVELIYA